VIFQINNSKELVIALMACLKAGLIPVCTLASHRRHEIGYLGRHAGARGHIVHGDDPRFDMVSFAREIRSEIPCLEHTLVVRSQRLPEGVLSLEQLAEGEDTSSAKDRLRSVPRDPYQVALFQLSGGTSDVPKIIPRFHNEYLYSMQRFIKLRGFNEQTVGFSPSPMLHNAPLLTHWGPVLLAGGEVAIATSLDVAAIADVLTARRPTWFGMPSVIIHRLMEAGLLDRSLFENAIGFSLTNSGAQVAQLTGAPAYQQYGMTEGFISAGRLGDPALALATTVGRSFLEMDDVRIVEPSTTVPVPDGEVGELIVKGPCTIRGYFNAIERNLEAFTADGYYRSGDLMSFRIIEGQRYLSFEGRIKDVIDRGGEKINSQEVERAAVQHPKVAAIAIVPMPDPHYGERSCAFIIPTEKSETITVSELGEFLAGLGLAKFKWPERIEIVDEFPTTDSAKLSKPKLKTMIAGKIESEQARTPHR
jgi:2,3-dihydroxybenzoate-AMP ligase